MSIWNLLPALLLVLVLGIACLCARNSSRQEAAGESGPGWGVGTRFFLILLRLCIGWHFLIEGVDKLQSASWSSEGYLRDSTGPLAPVFRDLAGERLIARLTLGSDGSFPEELNTPWQDYLDAVTGYYGLQGAQDERLKAAMDQAKAAVVTWLTTKPRLVEIPSPTPPPLHIVMTMPERLKEYERLKTKFLDIDEDDRVGHGSKPFVAWKAARSAWQVWRADLAHDAELIDRHMKRALRAVLLSFVLEDLPAASRQKIEAAREKIVKEAQKVPVAREDWDREETAQHGADAKVLAACRAELLPLRENKEQAESLQPLTWKIADRLVEPIQGAFPLELVPGGVKPPLTRWTMLGWADVIVKYGLVIVGVCLLAGLLTRTACLAGAVFLLLFFLAMPPLPGWPESGRSEGHYLYINKTLIEMVALLLLATTRSGRWLGLDSLWPLLRGRQAAHTPSPASPVAPRRAAAESVAVGAGRDDAVAPLKEMRHGT